MQLNEVRTRASVMVDGQQSIEEGTEEELLLKMLKHQRWSSGNASVRCFKCKKLVVTDVVFVPSVRTYMASLALFFSGIFSILCLVPFYYPELLGVVHVCSNPDCRTKLGENSGWMSRKKQD